MFAIGREHTMEPGKVALVTGGTRSRAAILAAAAWGMIRVLATLYKHRVSPYRHTAYRSTAGS